MLNGKNWWTKSTDVTYDYIEDFNERIEHAAKTVWEEMSNTKRPIDESSFIAAVKRVISISNTQRV